MHLSLYLLRSLHQLCQEFVPRAQLNLRLVLVKAQFFLDLGVSLVALLHVLIRTAQPLLILVHAHGQTLLELSFLGKHGRVVDLLHDVPLFPKLLLDVHYHIVSIPLAAVLHILNERVADLTDFNPRQNLRNLRLFNSVSPLLKIF